MDDQEMMDMRVFEYFVGDFEMERPSFLSENAFRLRTGQEEPYVCRSCKATIEWDTTPPNFRDEYHSSVANWKVGSFISYFRLHFYSVLRFEDDGTLEKVFQVMMKPENLSKIVEKLPRKCDVSTLSDLLVKTEKLINGWPAKMKDKEYFSQIFATFLELNLCLDICDSGGFEPDFCPSSESAFHIEEEGPETKKKKADRTMISSKSEYKSIAVAVSSS